VNLIQRNEVTYRTNKATRKVTGSIIPYTARGGFAHRTPPGTFPVGQCVVDRLIKG